jgi:hypothetical protein
MDEFWAHVPMAAAVLIIGLTFIFVLRKPLRDLPGRIRSLKHGETSIDMGPQAEEQQVRLSEIAASPSLLTTGSVESKGAVLLSEPKRGEARIVESPDSSHGIAEASHDRANVLRTVGLSPLVTEREVLILKDLENIPELEERVSLLARNLAIAQLQITAEHLYRVIFGSQLAALHHLNLYGATSKEKLEELFYKPAAQHWTEQYENYPAERYFHFMVSTGLMNLSTDDKATITAKGKALLEWIVANGLLMNKAF